MVEKRKLQSENISKILYNGKNHFHFFTHLEYTIKHNKDLNYFKLYNANLKKRLSILTKAHTLSEDDVKNHLDKCYNNNNIRVTRVYRNYYRGIYLTLKPETVLNAVTQIVPFFKNNAIKLIWWLYKTYRALSERVIVELKREIAALDITKIASRNITTFNHTARRLWVLCLTYHNPIDDLFQKVRDSYK